jgi:predicted PurR-regulated permease PerM
MTAHTDVQPVSIVPSQPNDVEALRLILEPTLTPVATAGIVLILSTFMLVGREDLRNRLIRLVGSGRVTVTTRMLDEAGHRISDFLFTQSLINGAFGICIAGGLLLIGVPYALLWGVVAALLRFVPYLGSLLALLMPAALAFVGSPGWGPAVETVVLFLGLDAVTAYAVEPVVIGTNTGLSSLALLISAMFWTWLWGPVGLVLSAPLTVCLTAVGKHVPGMEFLAILLENETPI